MNWYRENSGIRTINIREYTSKLQKPSNRARKFKSTRFTATAKSVHITDSGGLHNQFKSQIHNNLDFYLGVIPSFFCLPFFLTPTLILDGWQENCNLHFDFSL